jgi:hypothetical protein
MIPGSRLAQFLAAGHLVLVLWGAASLPWPASRLVEPLRWYSALSGADSNYGFYAPAVSSQVRGCFTLIAEDGTTWTDTLDQQRNSEAARRLGGSVDKMFTLAPQHQPPGFPRSLAASWAATLFARHPAARQVRVEVQAYDVPTMTDCRGGARPGWQTLYQANFTRTAPQED